MLTKFKVISAVGRFYSYTAKGDYLDCQNPTVIYGHNGHGKSTITAILKSFSQSNPNILKGRKSLGRNDAAQNVVIHSQNGTFRFDGTTWAPSFPIDWRMAIFDKYYVEDNLFI